MGVKQCEHTLTHAREERVGRAGRWLRISYTHFGVYNTHIGFIHPSTAHDTWCRLLYPTILYSHDPVKHGLVLAMILPIRHEIPMPLELKLVIRFGAG